MLLMFLIIAVIFLLGIMAGVYADGVRDGEQSLTNLDNFYKNLRQMN